MFDLHISIDSAYNSIMKLFVLGLVIAIAAVAAEPLFEQSAFAPGEGGVPAGWQKWSPRAEISPKLYVDEANSRGQAGSLAVSAASVVSALGGWERTVEGVKAGHWYRFVVHYRAERLEYEPRQVVPRLAWSGENGKRAGRPEYAYQTDSVDGWKRVTMDVPAPEGAIAAEIQLLIWNSSTGTVYWDDISLTPIPDPGKRPVKVASINLQPRDTGSAEASVGRFIKAMESTVPPGTDIILLPEGITVVGTGKKYGDVAEPIPGPTTKRLGEAARKHNAYLAAGIYEKEGAALYNTAVLLDRSGKLVGKYRKVYIPREETEGGIAPGSDYPVFSTDFGRVGMMICWDVQYADPARGLALGGAEMLLMPIWGGNETLAKARAIENRVFVVSSGYSYPTHIIDPDGEVLTVATDEGTAAIATIDLNKRYLEPWLGDMRGRFMKELRLDVPVR
jgi:predicted amidohydrolase